VLLTLVVAEVELKLVGLLLLVVLEVVVVVETVLQQLLLELTH
jgi:hypothetical protein